MSNCKAEIPIRPRFDPNSCIIMRRHSRFLLHPDVGPNLAILRVRMMIEKTAQDLRNRPMRILRLGERWIVQCPGFRCLAILDKEGKWWDVMNDRDLTNIVQA